MQHVIVIYTPEGQPINVIGPFESYEGARSYAMGYNFPLGMYWDIVELNKA